MRLSIPAMGINIIADSYYFVLDRFLLPNEETFEKALIIFRSLLNQWMLAVKKMNKEQIAYLPFDFADQGVGGLEVHKNDNQLIVRYFVQHQIFNVKINDLPTDYLAFYPSMSYDQMILNSMITKLWYAQGEFSISTKEFIDRLTIEKNKIPLRI